jgi:hypothetical protein
MYYGATSILSDRRRPCRFSIAADPAILSGPREIKGWLNGKQVIGSPIDLAPSSSEPLPSTDDEGGKDGRSLLVEGEPDSKRDAPVFLEEGWNLLLIRVCWINNWHFGGYWFQSTPKWPFRISLNDPSGTPIRNLTFDSERWRPTGHDGRPQP